MLICIAANERGRLRANRKSPEGEIHGGDVTCHGGMNDEPLQRCLLVHVFEMKWFGMNGSNAIGSVTFGEIRMSLTLYWLYIRGCTDLRHLRPCEDRSGR